jgi:hypothetical protein
MGQIQTASSPQEGMIFHERTCEYSTAARRCFRVPRR